jgi:hypothetical protein
MRGSQTPLKRGYRLRDGDQVPTVPATIREIMADPAFGRGVADVRAGRGYPRDFDAWGHTNSAWSYERGRQWATIAPRSVPLRTNGSITAAAVRWYGRADIL